MNIVRANYFHVGECSKSVRCVGFIRREQRALGKVRTFSVFVIPARPPLFIFRSSPALVRGLGALWLLLKAPQKASAAKSVEPHSFGWGGGAWPSL